MTQNETALYCIELIIIIVQCIYSDIALLLKLTLIDPRLDPLHLSSPITCLCGKCSLKAVAFSLECLCILHAKICISALFLIQEFPSCTIQIVLTWWLDITLALKIANVIYTFHLSPTSCDQDLGLTKPDKVALFQLWADIYHTYPDMWHWEGQAEPVGRLRPYYHLCLQDIRDFTTYTRGQEICRAAD